MSQTEIKPAAPKRGRWRRKLALAGGVLIVLLVVVYFVATSAGFLKGVILPKVSKTLGADVTMTDASISPFSRVQLMGLKVQVPGAEPILSVQELHANYSLWSIIGGTIVVSEVVVESPVISVVQNADGTCNLDVLTKNASKETKPSAPAATPSSKTPQIDIQKVSLNNATVHLVKNYSNGGKDVVEVTGLNFSVANLKNGQTGKLELGALIAIQKAARTNAAAAQLQAKLTGAFDFALSPDLKPGSVKGSTTISVSQATGALAQLNEVAATLSCDLTSTELKQLVLSLMQSGASLAEIRVSGPLDMAKTEGKLKLEIGGIDKRLFNLAWGSAGGMDFGNPTFNGTNLIELSKGGKTISISGGFDLAQLQVTAKDKQSPTLGLHSDYAVTVDQTAGNAVLQSLNLTGTQDSRALILVGLSSPMTIGFGNSSSAVGEASLHLAVTNLNLSDWKAFAGDSAPGGLVNVTLNLVSQKAGKQLAFDMDTHVVSFTTGAGTAAVNQGDIHTQARGSVTDLKLIKLDNYHLDMLHNSQSMASVSGSGTFDTTTQDADLQVAVKAAMDQLLKLANADPTQSSVGFKGHVTQHQKKVTLDGELALAPTTRATNSLKLNGSFDLNHPDAITGGFKMASDAMDLSSYYDLMTGVKPGAAQNSNAAAITPPATQAPASRKEPEAMKLPLKNFTLDLNLGHLFLHEMDISNWLTTASIDGGHIIVKPCQLAINGAPLKAVVDMDLGVPGYKYDIQFSAVGVPSMPLVDSFVPDRKGQISGGTSIDVQLKGVGVTPASLQTNLSGQFNFATSNLNLSVANVKSPLLNSIINVIVGIPDLIRNPTAALDGLIGRITGSGTQKGGWADDLTANPIDVISLNAQVADGKVHLQQSEVRSKAFQATATGDITLATIQSNSVIQIPVKIALARSGADKIGLVTSSTPTNAAYVSLPDFLTVKGTLGKPKTEVDKLALLTMAAKTGVGLGKKIGGAAGEKAGSLINTVGGLFGGSSPSTNASGTNATSTSTNKSPVSGILDLFKKPR